MCEQGLLASCSAQASRCGAVLPTGRSRPSWKFSQNRIGGFLEGAEVLWAWRRQRGPFLLGEQEKGVPSKEGPPRETWRLETFDSISKMAVDEIQLVGSSTLQRGPTWLPGAPEIQLLSVPLIRSPQGKGVGVSRRKGSSWGSLGVRAETEGRKP